MLHIVRLIERRFPDRSGSVVAALVALSAVALAIGAGTLVR